MTTDNRSLTEILCDIIKTGEEKKTSIRFSDYYDGAGPFTKVLVTQVFHFVRPITGKKGTLKVEYVFDTRRPSDASEFKLVSLTSRMGLFSKSVDYKRARHGVIDLNKVLCAADARGRDKVNLKRNKEIAYYNESVL